MEKECAFVKLHGQQRRSDLSLGGEGNWSKLVSVADGQVKVTVGW